MNKEDIKPRDLVTRESIRNAMIVSMAVGGSTNVLLLLLKLLDQQDILILKETL